MDILQQFLDYQASCPSPHSPKRVKEVVVAWQKDQRDGIMFSELYEDRGESRSLRSNWEIHPNIEHSHLYFGARRFWTDPWDYVPGHEYLCADPTQEPESEAFLSTCLTRPHLNCNTLFSSSAVQVGSSEDVVLSRSELVNLPREIHDLIISHLSLKAALSFYSSNRKLSKICDGTFWRFQTIRLHGGWLWELRRPNSFSPDDNWKILLQLLTKNRSKIREGAKPYWDSTVASKNAKPVHKSPDGAELSKVSLPLGLRNRQRIWMCLRFLQVYGS